MCEGPLIWFHVGAFDGAPMSAILECSACDYIILSGNENDAAHQQSEILTEGLAF